MHPTHWNPALDWSSATVIIIGGDPALSDGALSRLQVFRQRDPEGVRVIAANRGVDRAQWADMFVALDPEPAYWDPVRDMPIMKVVGVDADLPVLEGQQGSVLYAGPLYEAINVRPGHAIEIRNNLLAAMRLAEQMGASKIVLAGVDAAKYEVQHAATGFYGLIEGLAQLTEELRSKGIRVVDADTFLLEQQSASPQQED